MPALGGLAAAVEEEQRPTTLAVCHGVTVTPWLVREPNVVSNLVEQRAEQSNTALRQELPEISRGGTAAGCGTLV
jgi:hypothetical protein